MGLGVSMGKNPGIEALWEVWECRKGRMDTSELKCQDCCLENFWCREFPRKQLDLIILSRTKVWKWVAFGSFSNSAILFCQMFGMTHNQSTLHIMEEFLLCLRVDQNSDRFSFSHASISDASLWLIDAFFIVTHTNPNDLQSRLTHMALSRFLSRLSTIRCSSLTSGVFIVRDFVGTH